MLQAMDFAKGCLSCLGFRGRNLCLADIYAELLHDDILINRQCDKGFSWAISNGPVPGVLGCRVLPH